MSRRGGRGERSQLHSRERGNGSPIPEMDVTESDFIRPTQNILLRSRAGGLTPSYENLGGRMILLDEQRRHKEKMASAKPMVDSNPPWSYSHVRKSVKSRERVLGKGHLRRIRNINVATSSNPNGRPRSSPPHGTRAHQSSLYREDRRVDVAASTSSFVDEFPDLISDDLMEFMCLTGDQRTAFEGFVSLLTQFPDPEMRKRILTAALKEAEEQLLLATYSGPSLGRRGGRTEAEEVASNEGGDAEHSEMGEGSHGEVNSLPPAAASADTPFLL